MHTGGDDDDDLTDENLPPLGSLAQYARSRQLGIARAILLLIGLLTGGLYVAIYFFADAVVRMQVDKELGGPNVRAVLTPDEREELRLREAQAVRSVKLVSMIGMAVGTLYVLFGAFVKTFPVPITITALVLYLAGIAVMAAANPESLFAGGCVGIAINIAIIAALAKSIQAAIAYEEDRKRTAREARYSDGEPEDETR